MSVLLQLCSWYCFVSFLNYQRRLWEAVWYALTCLGSDGGPFSVNTSKLPCLYWKCEDTIGPTVNHTRVIFCTGELFSLYIPSIWSDNYVQKFKSKFVFICRFWSTKVWYFVKFWQNHFSQIVICKIHKRCLLTKSKSLKKFEQSTTALNRTVVPLSVQNH